MREGVLDFEDALTSWNGGIPMDNKHLALLLRTKLAWRSSEVRDPALVQQHWAKSMD